MPSDVFEAVVDLLDPELNIGSEANFDDNALIAKQRRKVCLIVRAGMTCAT